MHLSTHRVHSATRSRRGGALAASLFVAILLAGLGAGLVQLQTSVTQRHLASIDRARALYVAEAGLAEATHALAQGRSGAIGVANAPARHGSGLYWVEAHDAGDGQLRLVSTGIVGRSSSSVEATVDPTVNVLGAAGFFGEEEVVLLPGARALAGTQPARVRSNGDVSIASAQGGARVEGDVVAGPDGLVDVGPGAEVEGSVGRAEHPLLYRVPEAPELPVLELGGELARQEPRIGPGGLHVPLIELRGGQRMTLIGPLVLTVGALDMGGGTRLQIDAANGAVVVHVLHDLRLAPGSRWDHEAGGASDVTFVVHQQHAPVLRPKGSFVGALLAPHAELELPAGLSFTGTAFARRLVFDHGARATWDPATADRLAGLPSEPTLLAWGFAERPESPLLGGVLPAKRWLAQQGITPIEAADEAAALEVTVQYVDAEGGIAVYTGPAAGVPEVAAIAPLGALWFEEASDWSTAPQQPTPRSYPPPGPSSPGPPHDEDDCEDDGKSKKDKGSKKGPKKGKKKKQKGDDDERDDD